MAEQAKANLGKTGKRRLRLGEVEKGRDREGNPKYKWQPKDLSQKELDSIAQSISSAK